MQKIKIRIHTLFIYFLLFSSIIGKSQEKKESYREIDKSNWEKIIKGKDYTEATIEAPEIPDMQTPEVREVSPVIKILLYICIIALLVFIIIKIFGKHFLKNNISTESDKILIRDIEEKPMESDLEKYLLEAIKQSDFKLAIRLYYLIVLKALHTKNVIIWKKNKTNTDYLSELMSKHYYMQFATQTNLFEFVWYSNLKINAQQFEKIKPSFESLIKSIDL